MPPEANDWLNHLPFACLVTDKVVRKTMTTRIMENVITAVVAAIGGGYFVLSISIAKSEERINAIERSVSVHVQTEERDRKEILTAVNDLRDCLMKRTCTK